MGVALFLILLLLVVLLYLRLTSMMRKTDAAVAGAARETAGNVARERWNDAIDKVNKRNA